MKRTLLIVGLIVFVSGWSAAFNNTKASILQQTGKITGYYPQENDKRSLQRELSQILSDKNNENALAERFTASVSPESQSAKLIPSDIAGPGQFGNAIAMDGNTIIVGASQERSQTNNTLGAAYVFVRNGEGWTQQARLIDPTGTPNAQFGTSVAISGDTIMVGEKSGGSDLNNIKGLVCVFIRVGAVWTLQQKLGSADGTLAEQFGFSIAINGETAIIGAPEYRPTPSVSKGAAYIFTRLGSNWSQQAKLVDSFGNVNDRFGFSVTVDGETAIVGAVGGDVGEVFGLGTASVFLKTGNAWTQQTRLFAADGATGDLFATSLKLHGDTAIIGSPEHRVGTSMNAGAAYVFVRSGTNWTQRQEINSPDAAVDEKFGTSVDFSDEILSVGASRGDVGSNQNQGSADVFVKNNVGDWIPQAKLVASDGAAEDKFGSSLAVDGNKIVVGAPFSSPGGGGLGAAYFFIKPPGSPNLQAGSDSGISDSDNITNQQTLLFDIGALTEGATAQLLRGDVVVASATVAGNSIVLSDTNAPANGVFQYSARQIIGGEISSTSQSVVVTIDSATPLVTVNQAPSQLDPTTERSARFSIVFNEPVTGFIPADISLAGSTADVSASSILFTGTISPPYNILITEIVSNGQFVKAGVPAGVATDAAGNFNSSSTSTDNTVTIDNVRPKVTINQAAEQADPTTFLPVNFTVVFDEPVTGFEATDISFLGSSANTFGATVNLTGSGMTYNVAVGNIISNGQTIRASIQPGAVQDILGNSNEFSTSTDNTIILDNVAPTVRINQAATQSDPATVQPVNFTATFSEPVTGFDASDVTLAGSTANVSAAVITITGSGANYNVAVSNINSSGQVRVSVRANAAQDTVGNLSTASTSTDNTVTLQIVSRAKQSDFDGDGRADISVFRPSNGAWYLNRSTAGFTGISFGQQGDQIVPADYDGDGKTDIAVFRAGTFYRLNSSNGQFVSTQFGQSGDLPVPGDFDGDGKADLAVFRPANGAWYRINSSNNQFVAVQFGQAGDKPQIADFDGDGKTDLATFRPSNGGWYVLRSSDGSFYGTGFGQQGDIANPADFDGDGKADIAVFRPSNSTWYRINSSNNQFVAQQFGTSEDVPVAADYDGDGKDDIAVFRPSTGSWYLLRSTTGFTGVQFGTNGDVPTPAAFGQ